MVAGVLLAKMIRKCFPTLVTRFPNFFPTNVTSVPISFSHNWHVYFRIYDMLLVDWCELTAATNEMTGKVTAGQSEAWKLSTRRPLFPEKFVTF